MFTKDNDNVCDHAIYNSSKLEISKCLSSKVNTYVMVNWFNRWPQMRIKVNVTVTATLMNFTHILEVKETNAK